MNYEVNYYIVPQESETEYKVQEVFGFDSE